MPENIRGTRSEGQERPGILNTILLNEACLKGLSLRGGERILNEGRGLGQFSRATAKQGGTKLLGIECSEKQTGEEIGPARPDRNESRVEFRQGDVRKLPLREKD